MKKRFLSILLSLSLVFSTSACSKKINNSSLDSSDKIYLGFFEPLSGSVSSGAAEEIKGLHDANFERPTVTINGEEKRVMIVAGNNENKPEKSGEVIEELISKYDIKGLFGSYSSTLSLGGYNTILSKKIPTITIGATNEEVTRGNPYYYRVCFIDSFQGKKSAEYIMNKLNIDDVIILTEKGESYSEGLSSSFISEFSSLGGKYRELKFNAGETEFNEQMKEISKSKPKLIYFTGTYVEANAILKVLEENNLSTILFGGDGFETGEMLLNKIPSSISVLYTTFFDENADMSDKIPAFVEDYKNKNGQKSPMGSTVLAYDAYNFLLNAIESGNSTDPDIIIQELNRLEYDGVAGNIKFDENGNTEKPVVIKQVVDGRFIYKDVIE